VTAIASLHWGELHLEDAGPGLVARIVLPRPEITIPDRGTPTEMLTMEADG